METSLMACNSNWLNATTDQSDTNQYTSMTYYPYYHPIYYTSPIRPIKLTLTEIEKLRKIANNDELIRKILSKFTEMIEITVDF